MNQSNDKMIGNLPANINALNPTPKPDAKSIEAVVKSGNTVVGYKLSDGKIISKNEGVDLAKNGDIKGVAVAKNQQTEYLRALPDGEEKNNLGNLPVITQ